MRQNLMYQATEESRRTPPQDASKFDDTTPSTLHLSHPILGCSHRTRGLRSPTLSKVPLCSPGTWPSQPTGASTCCSKPMDPTRPQIFDQMCSVLNWRRQTPFASAKLPIARSRKIVANQCSHALNPNLRYCFPNRPRREKARITCYPMH